MIRGYVSSRVRRTAIEAQDDSDAWIRACRDAWSEGRRFEALAALAAAEWLDPGHDAVSELEPVLTEGVDLFPPGVHEPDKPYRERVFPERHWSAWAMKNRVAWEYLLPLLRGASEENFSVRTRIYRSLGQMGHPAAAQCLHEGTADPHPFARAQAVRSLGWLADPTCLVLLERLAKTDPVPDVRRMAKKSTQRILGYWMFHGEWAEITKRDKKKREVAAELARAGLHSFASEFFDLRGLLPNEKCDEALLLSGGSGHYWDSFEEAIKDEKRFRHPEDRSGSAHFAQIAEVREGLQAADPDSVVNSICCATARNLDGLVDDVMNLVGHAHAEVAWHARRAMRWWGRGELSQRRTHPAPWVRG